MAKMTKVTVNQGLLKDGRVSKRRIVWATFCIAGEAHRYAEQLQRNEPTWVVRVAE